MIVGIVERKGSVVLKVAENRKRTTLHEFVIANFLANILFDVSCKRFEVDVV